MPDQQIPLFDPPAPPTSSEPEPNPEPSGVEVPEPSRLVVPSSRDLDPDPIRSYLARSDGKTNSNLMIEVPSTERVKASEARFMIEVWMLPVEARNTITRSILTMLWVNGETQGPGGDQMIFECPGQECTGLFMPGFNVFTKPDCYRMVPARDEAGRFTGGQMREAIPLVLCMKCNRIYPRENLVDRRQVTGTYDILGKHLTFRFHQVGCDADILKRILHENMHRPVPEMLNGERGATDRYIRAQNRRDCVYLYIDHIMAETAKGVDTDVLFANFIRA